MKTKRILLLFALILGLCFLLKPYHGSYRHEQYWIKKPIAIRKDRITGETEIFIGIDAGLLNRLDGIPMFQLTDSDQYVITGVKEYRLRDRHLLVRTDEGWVQ